MATRTYYYKGRKITMTDGERLAMMQDVADNGYYSRKGYGDKSSNRYDEEKIKEKAAIYDAEIRLMEDFKAEEERKKREREQRLMIGRSIANDAINRGMMRSYEASTPARANATSAPNTGADNAYAQAMRKTALEREKARLQGLEGGTLDEASDYQKRMDAIDLALSKVDSNLSNINRANSLRKIESDARLDELFDQYAQKGAEMVNPTVKQAQGIISTPWGNIGGKDIANKVTYGRDNAGELQLGANTRSADAKYAVYQNMTDDEVAVYNYLLTTDPNRAEEYLMKLDPELQRRESDRRMGVVEGVAEIAPVAASAATVLTAPVKGTAYVGAMADRAMGRDINTDSNAYRLAREADAMRGTVGGNINEGVQNATGSRFLGNAGEFLYQIGLSMADTLVNTAITGGNAVASSALMGGSAASSAMIDAKERGGNDTQALTVGALAGIAEALFEKVSIENFLSEATAGTKGAWLLNILRQMGIEASEEGATEVANIISDSLVMGDLSQYKDMTAGEIALQVAQAALGGAISGAGMGGIAQLGNYATRKANERAAAAPVAEPAAEADPIREAAMQAAIAQEEQTEQPMEKAAPMRAAKPAEQTPAQEAQKPAESTPAMEGDNDTPELAAPTRAVTMTRRDNAVNTSYDEAVEVVGIDSVDDGKVYVLDSNDDVISLNDVDFSDSNTAALYRAAGSFDTATAQRFVQEYDGGDVQQYAQAFASVYNDGKAGIDYNTTLTQRASAATLTESQRITAHAGGQKAASASLPNMPKKFTPGLTRAYTKASLTAEGRENTKKFRRQLQALDTIGKKYNREIVLVSSLKGMNIGGVTITGNVNGAYDPTTKRIYVAADAQDGAFAYVAMHELVHSIKDSDSKAYDRLRDVVFEALEASGEDVDALIDYQINSVYKGEIDRDGAIEEVISNTAPTVLMDEQFVRDLYNNDRTLFDKIREFFEELKQVFAELTQSGSWAQDTVLDEESVAKIAKVFDKVAMETAAQPDMNNLVAVDAAPTQTDAGVVIDEAGVKFSINTKDAWAKHMREAYGNTADVRSAIDFVNDISQVIMDNESLRDYMVRGDIPYSKIGPIRSNVEYKITFDLDTLCQRVWQYAALRDSIIDMAGRPLTKKESRQLIDYIEKMGGQIPCRYCYVEGKRALFADSYLNFLNFRRDVMNEADDDVARTKMYSYDTKTGKLGAAAEKVFDEWRGIRSNSNTYNPQSLEEHYVNFQQLRNAVIDFLEENYPGDIAQTRTSEDGYNFLHYEVRNSKGRKVGAPAMAKQVLRHFGAMSGADANARASFVARKIIQPWMQARYEGIESVKNTRGSKFDARVLDLERVANNYAASASSAHLFEPYQPYTDQLSHVSKDVLKYVNAMGGVRIHSSNDFQMRNIVDYLQFFAEMASMKLMSHSYTKNLTFAEIAGKLGGRVNVSIALNGDFSTGIQENISEGAPWGEARALQKRNPNVGVMAMITNDDQLSFVLNTDWVQMTIPFHSSGIESEYTDALRWTSYQSIQNERPYADSTMRDELKADGVEVPAKLAGRELREMYAKHFGKTLITDKNGKYITPHFFPHDTQVTTQGGKTVIVPGHHNDAKRYFELCEQFGVRPRFDGAMVQDRNGNTIPAVEHPNYVKLIKETARTDSEQTAISMDALTDPEFREWLVERMKLEVPAERNSSTGFRDVMGIGKTFIENVINNPAAKDLPYGKLPAALEERVDMLGDMSNAPREEFDVRFTGGEPVRGVDYEVVKSKPKLAQMTEAMKARAPKFSIKDPVERVGNLVAVHSLNYENAMKAVKRGGMPASSWAITTAKLGVPNYADITFVAGSESVDPALDERNKAYAGDAHSPRYPETSKGMSDAAKKRVGDMIDKHAGKLGEVYTSEARRLLGSLESKDEYIKMDIKDNAGLMAVYLSERGAKLRPASSKSEMWDNKDKLDRVIRFRGGKQRYMDWAMNLLGKDWNTGEYVTRQTEYGTERVPATLENVTEVMTAQNGGEMRNALHTGGFRGVHAALVRQMGTLDEIRSRKQQLQAANKETIAQYRAAQDMYSNTISLMKDAGASSYRGSTTSYAEETLHYIIREKVFATNDMLRILKLNGYEKADAGLVRNITHTLSTIRNLPTDYFEVKAGRVFGIHEVKLALLPEGKYNDLAGALEGLGIAVARYSGGNTGRAATLNQSAAGLLFSAKDPAQRERDARTAERIAEGRKQSAAQQKLEGKHDAETAKLKERIAGLEQQVKDERAAGQINTAIERKAGSQAVEDERLAARMAEGRVRAEERRKGRELAEAEKQKLRDHRQNERMRNTRDVITERVKTISNWITSPTDKRFVPESMQLEIGRFISAINMGFKDDSKTKERWMWRMDRMNAAVKATLKASPDNSTVDISEGTVELIEDFTEEIKKQGIDSIKQMSEEQLDTLADILGSLKKEVIDANKSFIGGRLQERTVFAEDTIARADRTKLEPKNNVRKAVLSNRLVTGNLKPPVFFRLMGGRMRELGEDLLNAERDYSKGMMAARDFYKALKEHYKTDDWLDVRKKGNVSIFELESGEKITLSRDQALNIYVLNLRERLESETNHLRGGGITFRKDAYGKEVKGDEPHILTDADITAIRDWLTPSQLQFAHRLVSYMSTELSQLGNRTSLRLVGRKLFKGEHYVPFNVDKNHVKHETGKAGEVDQPQSARVKNKGMTKSTLRNASTPLVIDGLTDVFAAHVQEMCTYAAFAIPQDNILRVMNYKAAGSQTTVRSAMNAAYGNQLYNYLDALMADIGGKRSGSAMDTQAMKLISKFKAGSVLSSMSVAIQQPSSIARAFSVLKVRDARPPHFAKVGKTIVNKSFEEAMQYSGTAVIKDMGGFDISSRSGVEDWLLSNKPKGFKEHSDKVGTWAPEQLDKLTFGSLWEACKVEVARNNKGLEFGGEQHLLMTGERFDEVIRLTQVYDSTLSRSENMRTKTAYASMATAFMGEPTTAMNLLFDAMYNAKNTTMEGRIGVRKAAAAYVGTVVLNAALKSVVYAMRDDDEDQNYWEKYKEALGEALLGEKTNKLPNWLDSIVSFVAGSEFSPVGQVPILSDVSSIIGGYDVNRSDMDAISSLVSATLNLFSDKRTTYAKVRDMVGAVSVFTGIPVRNLWRDAEGILRTVGVNVPATANSAASAAGALEEAYEALTEGNRKAYDKYMEKAEKLIRATLEKNADEKGTEYTDIEQEVENRLVRGLRDALKDDERIKQMAEYRVNDWDYDGYMALYNELLDEGFPEAAIKGAASSAVTALEETNVVDSKPYNPQHWTKDDLQTAFEEAMATGDSSGIEAMVEEMRNYSGTYWQMIPQDADQVIKGAAKKAYEAISNDPNDKQAVDVLGLVDYTKDDAQGWANDSEREQMYSYLAAGDWQNVNAEIIVLKKSGVKAESIKSGITNKAKRSMKIAKDSGDTEAYNRIIDTLTKLNVYDAKGNRYYTRERILGWDLG